MKLYDHPYQVKLRRFHKKHKRFAENGSRSCIDAICYDVDTLIFDLYNRRLKKAFDREVQKEQQSTPNSSASPGRFQVFSLTSGQSPIEVG